MEAEGKRTSSVILRFLFEQLVGGDVTYQMGKPGAGAGTGPWVCEACESFSHLLSAGWPIQGSGVLAQGHRPARGSHPSLCRQSPSQTPLLWAVPHGKGPSPAYTAANENKSQEVCLWAGVCWGVASFLSP